MAPPNLTPFLLSTLVIVYAPSHSYPARGVTPDGEEWASWDVCPPDKNNTSARKLGVYILGTLTWY